MPYCVGANYCKNVQLSIRKTTLKMKMPALGVTRERGHCGTCRSGAGARDHVAVSPSLQNLTEGTRRACVRRKWRVSGTDKSVQQYLSESTMVPFFLHHPEFIVRYRSEDTDVRSRQLVFQVSVNFSGLCCVNKH
jgi:hypothetical protein